jgi:hypothetical protein
MNDGHLPAEKRRIGGRSTWTVLEEDLKKWAEEWLSGESDLLSDRQLQNNCEQILNSSERSRTFMNEAERTRANKAEHSRTTVNVHEQNSEHPRTLVNDREHPRTNTSEQNSFLPSHPPVELYLALVDRLQRAERRTVELELTLQQSQRLLCENAESITEREARAKQAEAVVAQHQQREQELAAQLQAVEEAKNLETQRLTAQLEATRQQLETAQKPSGLFSWLGLRKKRTTTVSVDKAV